MPPARQPREPDRLAAPAQRSRHRRRRDRARPDGGRGPRRGHAVRQWRAHRQCRHRDAGVEHVHARAGPQARLLRHPPDEGRLRVFEPAAHSGAPSLCRRAGLHGLLRLAPGRHQQGHEGDQDGQQAALGGALSADRPAGCRPHLRGDHPHQLAVGQGRHRLCASGRLRPEPAAQSAGRVLARTSRRSPTPRARSFPRSASTSAFARSMSTSPTAG